MSYFPILIQFDNAKVLIAGGGAIALHKAELLSQQGADVTVIAPEICNEIRALPVKLEERCVRSGDAKGKILVVDASGSKEAEAILSKECKEEGIPYNCAGHGDACTAIFPAVFKKGRTTVAVSSLGASPPASVWLRDLLAKQVPENMDEILERMAEIRPVAKEKIEGQAKRKEFFHEALRKMIDSGEILSDEDLKEILSRYTG